jgi:hypothetical protein
VIDEKKKLASMPKPSRSMISQLLGGTSNDKTMTKEQQQELVDQLEVASHILGMIMICVNVKVDMLMGGDR